MLDPKDKKKRVTFTDVAGAKEAKEELMEVVEFLQHPKKFLNIGAKIPKGVLLLGPPGTGKTLMAKAVAGEAGVPFFNISGSEFVEMFVGVGASRVRDLFKQAKKNAPAIVFIDEIDAVGRHRGAGLGGGHDEREQTLNQILVEMDGFETDTNVIVIAATNRPDVLDPALLRPGRFDRRVVLDLPDINERESILKIHAKNKPLAKDVDLKVIAQRTPGFSGADISNLVNEAAILAARRGKKTIGMRELSESIEKVILGPERKSRALSSDEKKIVAYHEAGHALVAASLPKADPVQKVSIISRGQAGGYTLAVPTEDKRLQSRSYFVDELAVLLGGYVAEETIFGDTTTGAANDLERATRIARSLVTRYGMSKLGPRTFGKKEELIFLGREISEEKDYSERTALEIDKEVSRFVSEARSTAQKIIGEKRGVLEKLVKVLLEKETIEKQEFEEITGISQRGKEKKKEMIKLPGGGSQQQRLTEAPAGQ
jgi:cell division protease FtsH